MIGTGGLYVAGVALGGMILLAGLAVRISSAEVAPAQEAAPREAPRERLVTQGVWEGESDLKRELAQAGFMHPAAETIFSLVKLLSGAVAALIAAALLLRYFDHLALAARLSLLFPAFALGYLLPRIALQRRRKSYRRRIERAVPDALDLIQICVDAGQSLDHAFRRVARELGVVHPELASHFAWSSEAIAAGLEREEALVRIAEETGNEDLRLLSMTVVQASRLGTPVSRTLRTFGDDLRDRRIRKVEEWATVLPTKMTLGTMLFTVPPLLILLLTPAVVRIMELL